PPGERAADPLSTLPAAPVALRDVFRSGCRHGARIVARDPETRRMRGRIGAGDCQSAGGDYVSVGGAVERTGRCGRKALGRPDETARYRVGGVVSGHRVPSGGVLPIAEREGRLRRRDRGEVRLAGAGCRGTAAVALARGSERA